MRAHEQRRARLRAYTAAGTLVALAVIGICAVRAQDADTSQSNVRLTGVNVAGAEFGSAIPGQPGTDYFYPKDATIDYFSRKGMNVLRIPFRWERIQPALGAALDAAEAALLDGVIKRAREKGLRVILDVHNYAAYRKQPIGSAAVPPAALADLWGRLAARYKGDGSVIFGLMNEPKGLPTETWLEAANAAIAEIRRQGARNLVLVPGNGWTGAHSWFAGRYGTPNSEVMRDIADPADNYAYEVHQYLDRDFSGTQPECRSETIGADTLKAFTEWLRRYNRRGFLGEFGGGANATCLAALEAMLKLIDANSDVWLGWTYWAAGPWPREYFTSIEPLDGRDRPQMAVLARHLARRAP